MRIETEKKVVEAMIGLYCRKMERNGEMCAECRELLEYAWARLERCRFGDEKPSCKKCKVHCYKPEMRERIRMVMRWAGPRMVLYKPWWAVRHLVG